MAYSDLDAKVRSILASDTEHTAVGVSYKVSDIVQGFGALEGLCNLKSGELDLVEGDGALAEVDEVDASSHRDCHSQPNEQANIRLSLLGSELLCSILGLDMDTSTQDMAP